MLTHRVHSSEDTTPTTLPRQSLLGYNAIDEGTMAKSLDLQLKASLDSALQDETIWIRSQISTSERQHNGHQQKDHKVRKQKVKP